MSLNVQVKIEGAPASVSATDKVTEALGRTEDAGEKAGEGIAKGSAEAQRALTNLGRAFAGLETVMAARARATQVHTQLTNNLATSFARLAQTMEARARATEVHNRLNNTLTQSFGSLAQAIAHEQQILDAIHGPMQRYEADVRALDALHARGAISASQYAAALAKSRSAAGMKNPADAVSLPGAPKGQATTGANGALNGIVGATAGLLTAREALDMADSYIGLENRLRQVTKSQAELNATMGRIKQIANTTRSDLSATGESYVRLVQATKGMGVSQERAFKITETLSMALQSSGASASEAAAGTLQLMQALGAGALQGDEFRSVAENMPMLLDVLSKQLGVTRGQLKALGADGKITTDVMIKALEAFGPDARRTFEQSEETFGQFATRMKNNASAFLGGGISIKKAYDNWGAATQALRLEEIELGNAMARAHPMYATLISDATGMTAATYALTKSQMQHMQQTKLLVDSLIAMHEQMQIIKSLQRQADFKAFTDDLVASGRAGKEGGDRTADAFQRAKQAAREANNEAKQWVEHMRELADRSKEARFVGDGTKQNTYVRENLIPDSATGGYAIDTTAQQQADALWGKNAQASNDWKQRVRQDQKEVDDGFKRIGESIQQNLGDALADAALQGEFSFSKMADAIIADLARIAAQQAAMGLMGLFSGGGGGPLAGTSIAAARGDGFGAGLLGFASGGSFMVGGHGGTDTTPVAFMATPGERVTIETPPQQRAADAPRSNGPLAVNVVLDQRAITKAIDSPLGARVLDDVQRKYGGRRRN